MENIKIKVLQLTEEHADELFLSIKWLKDWKGREPDLTHYECIYEGEVESKDNRSELLEDIFTLFNVGPWPEEYKGHSLSVSDIVVLQEEDGETYWFCDSSEFVELKEGGR